MSFYSRRLAGSHDAVSQSRRRGREGTHPDGSPQTERRDEDGGDSKWLPLSAEQYFTTNPPGFLWYGTVHPFPLVSVSAADIYIEGHGSMVIKALSFIPLGTARGPEMDQGELLRYLGETTWFPTALLSDYIEWETIDTQRAKATISLPGLTASGILHVDQQGRCTHFTAQRNREMNGFRIPMTAAPGGDPRA